jgi:O-methyltransferase
MSEIQQPTVRKGATPYLDEERVCRQSPLGKAMKSVLSSAPSVVPGPIYRPIYDLLFAAYRYTLSGAYFRHVTWHWITRNRSAYFRAKSVYDVMLYSLVGAAGLEATFDAARNLGEKEVIGDFVECGVARGGCSALMATVARQTRPPRKMWLFDSFEGLPSPTTEDYGENRQTTGSHIRPLELGSCLGTKEQVEWILFSRFRLDRRLVFLVKGWFQNTLPVYKDRIGPIALLRIDGDWYESTLCCLENLYDNVSPGGCVIVDDYGVCYGCKKAVHEFLRKKNLHPDLIPDSRGGIQFSKDSQ